MFFDFDLTTNRSATSAKALRIFSNHAGPSTIGMSLVSPKSKRRWFGNLMLATLCTLGVTSIESSISLGQGYKNNQDEPWNKYLAKETLRLSEDTQEALNAVTKENWNETKELWRGELQDMLGLAPWPERGDLNVHVEATRQLETISVSNLSFEPSPGLYATANLYLPKGEAPKEGWPAVVYVCGHARADEFGRLMGNKTGYQHHGLWLAKHGFACIIVDTVQLGEFQGEHHGTFSQGRWDWISKGYTPAGVEAWIAIRSLELLLERDDIKHDAIGITGRSGGGAYSWYAAALDERFRAVVPVAGITDLQDHVIDGCIEGHCDCMFMINKYKWDFGKLAALIAPRPLMLTNTDSDTIFPLSGVMRIHNQLHQHYTRLGVPNSYGLLIAPGPHKDVQELQVGAFKWLSKHLTGNELVVNSAAEKELEAATMVAFPREMPLKENVTNLSKWFVRDRESSVTLWEKEGSQWLDRVLSRSGSQEFGEQNVAPVSKGSEHLETARLETDPQALSENHRSPLSPADVEPSVVLAKIVERDGWDLLQLKDADGWNRGLLRFKAKESEGAGDKTIDSPTDIIHLGAWRGENLSFQAIKENDETFENWRRKGTIAETLQANPNSTHYFLLPRGFDLESHVTSISELNHLHRRFYLLGDSLEQLQLRDEWEAIQLILSLQQPDHSNPKLLVAGHNRSGISAALLTWKLLQQGDEHIKPQWLKLDGTSNDPRLYACLPSFEQLWNFDDLLGAIGTRIDVIRSGSVLDLNKLQAVDTRIAPQLATGAVVQLIGSDKARITSRTTRWSMANLGDLHEFDSQSGDSKLPPDSLAGVQYAVPGVEAEIRFLWRKAGGKSWNTGEWIKTSANNDFEASLLVESLEPNSRYEYQVETKPIGGERNSSSVSGSFTSFPVKQSDAPTRIAIATMPVFADRDGTFGFDAIRSMQKRSTNLLITKALLPFSISNEDVGTKEIAQHIERQQILGLRSVQGLVRRTPNLALTNLVQKDRESIKPMAIGGQGEIWIPSPAQNWDEFAAQVNQSSTPFKLAFASADQSESIKKAGLSKDVILFQFDGERTALVEGTLTEATSQGDANSSGKTGPMLVSVGPMSMRAWQRSTAKSGDGQNEAKNEPSFGYVEIEIPGSKAKTENAEQSRLSQSWAIRIIDAQGNVVQEKNLIAKDLP